MPLEIRLAQKEDSYALAKILVLSWKAAYKGIVDQNYLDNLDIDKQKNRMEKIVSSENNKQYIATENNSPIGLVCICTPRDSDMENVGEVKAIYLLPEFFGSINGYGKRLMDVAIEKLVEMGYNMAYLWVLEENFRARRFYGKCGFAFEGKIQEIELGNTIINEMRYVKNLK